MGDIPAPDLVNHIRSLTVGTYCTITGGAVAAAMSPDVEDFAYGDVDVFCHSQAQFISLITELLTEGLVLDDRDQMKWRRWLTWGFASRSFANSAHLIGVLDGLAYDLNMVFKRDHSGPLSSTDRVLSSFDLGVVCRGWDMRHDEFRDMRPFWFPQEVDLDNVGLLPDAHEAWEQGLIVEYKALRQADRAVRVLDRGHRIGDAVPTLVQGYRIAAKYKLDSHRQKDQTLGTIYSMLADNLEAGTFEPIREMARQLPVMDELDELIEAMD